MVYTLLVGLIILASVLMIIIVLVQESKGGGLSSQFSSSNQLMGTPRTTQFVEKLTWGLAAAMVIISILCAHTAPKAVTDESVMEKTATQTETTNPTNMPGFGAGQPTKDAAHPAKDAAQPAATTPVE